MRIAIVNDLALAREVLRRAVLSVPGCSVAWAAENGAEAVQKTQADRPDVILMDLIMPVMDGVEATRQIMATAPCAILLVTSSVRENYGRVFAAMGYGALDALNTPSLDAQGNVAQGTGIIERIERLARSASTTAGRSVAGAAWPAAAGRQASPQKARTEVVALGASTGGPAVLATILGSLPADLNAVVVIVQHIDAGFAAGLVTWLQSKSRLPVRLARDGEKLTPGQVFVAGSNDHLAVGDDGKACYTPHPAGYLYRPSVDVLFESLALNRDFTGSAALLTGMGTDGARGLLALRRAGWLTIAEAASSCVIYGMPKAAVQIDAAEQVLPADQIAAAILRHAGSGGKTRGK